MRAEQAQAAAQWWSDLLVEGGNPARKVGDRELTQGVARIIALFGGAQPPITEDEATSFRDALASAIEAETSSGVLWVDVDYHPCRILQLALVASGLERRALVLPYKHMMRISTGQTEVRAGYGRGWQTIWSTATAEYLNELETP